MQGTVEGVDPGYGHLDVRYDQQRTRLFYQAREHAVEGRERGDVIRFDTTRSGRELSTRQIQVVRNAQECGLVARPVGD